MSVLDIKDITISWDQFFEGLGFSNTAPTQYTLLLEQPHYISLTATVCGYQISVLAHDDRWNVIDIENFCEDPELFLDQVFERKNKDSIITQTLYKLIYG